MDASVDIRLVSLVVKHIDKYGDNRWIHTDVIGGEDVYVGDTRGCGIGILYAY